MADTLSCEGCGAGLPAGRTWCGRCGSLRVRKAVEPAGQPSRLSVRLALGGFVVVAGVAAILVTATAEQSGSMSEEARVPDTATREATRGSVGQIRDDRFRPASEFVATDASRLGAAAYNNADMSSAADQYGKAVEADPNDAAALNNLGQVLVRTGRAREAIPYFDRAIALAPDVWSYHFNRARGYSELKEWREAIAGYTEAARLFPDDYATQFNLARARQASGDLAGAIAAYEKAIELAPGQADFHLTHGQALEQAGRHSEAKKAYERFLEMEPDGPEADKVKARLSPPNDAKGQPPATP